MFTQVDLRLVMRRWPSGVAILTAADSGKVHGMTVNSFTSVSVDPPMITVTLANDTRAKTMVEKSGFFAVNLLSENQRELSDIFAGRIADHEDRFEGTQVITGLHQLPLLREAAAHLECRVVHSYAMQHSTLYVAEVLNAQKKRDVPPLVYLNRGYHRIIK